MWKANWSFSAEGCIIGSKYTIWLNFAKEACFGSFRVLAAGSYVVIFRVLAAWPLIRFYKASANMYIPNNANL